MSGRYREYSGINLIPRRRLLTEPELVQRIESQESNSAAMDFKLGDRIQGRWEVLRALQGGLGRVYIAYDHQDGEATAIKTFMGVVEAEMVDRFRQEALAWIKLEQHPHIVRAGRFEVWNGRPFLFLEYVGGGDLSAWIGSRQLMERPEQILDFALQFCDGMEHARQRGLQAHRDVKPANCMITQDGRLKITDFGLAKVAGKVGLVPQAQAREWVAEVLSGKRSPDSLPPRDVSITETGVAMGTCTHMAPEQFTDAAHVDMRADIYSFGVMLFEMVTGRLPFEGTSFYGLALKHVKEPPPRLSGGPPGMAELVAQCLAKNPQDRPADFAAVRRVLEEIYMASLKRCAPPTVGAIPMDAIDKSNQAAGLVNLGLLQEGLRAAEEALELEPELWPALVNRGYALQRLRRCDEAMYSFEKALLIKEEAVLWSHIGVTLALLEHDAAEAALHKALQLDELYVHAHHNLAMHLAGKGRLKEARSVFEGLLAIAPRTAQYWLGQGMVCFNLQDFEGAKASFLRCVQLDPAHAHGWCYLGEAELAIRGWDEALPCFKRAVQEGPNLAKGWLHLGRGMVDAKKYAEALPYLEKALALNPRDALAHYVMGSSLLLLGRREEAVECMKMADALGYPEARAVLKRIR